MDWQASGWGSLTGIFSAAAAAFAAGAAFLLWRAQVRTYRESVRPELLLTGWEERPPRSGRVHPTVAFTSIRNIGRGSALHVHVNAFRIDEKRRPLITMTTISEPLIPPGESVAVDGDISINWQAWPEIGGGLGKLGQVNIRALCWDTAGLRHDTRFSLLAAEPGKGPLYVAGASFILPGVLLGQSRQTRAVPVWWLKVRRQVARFPLIGKHFSDDY